METFSKLIIYGILSFLLVSRFPASANDDFKKGFTYNTKELLAWRAPVSIYRNLRYYQSGVDSKGRPVVIQECGQWDLAQYMARGGESARNVSKYVQQSYIRLSKESDVFDTRNGFFLVLDASGFSIRQLATPGIMALMVQITQMLITVFNRDTSNLILVNMDPGGMAIWSIMRWMFGSKLAGMEVYGNDHSVERLLQDIPKDQLSSKYGGNEGFQPFKSFDIGTEEPALAFPATAPQEPALSEKETQSLLSFLVPGFNNTEQAEMTTPVVT